MPATLAFGVDTVGSNGRGCGVDVRQCWIPHKSGHYPHFVDISAFRGYYPHIVDIVDISAFRGYYLYWSHYELLSS